MKASAKLMRINVVCRHEALSALEIHVCDECIPLGERKKKYPIIGKIPEAVLFCQISISIKGVLFEETPFEGVNLPCVPLLVTCIIDRDRLFPLFFFCLSLFLL